jgi:hypothetical protein
LTEKVKKPFQSKTRRRLLLDWAGKGKIEIMLGRFAGVDGAASTNVRSRSSPSNHRAPVALADEVDCLAITREARLPIDILGAVQRDEEIAAGLDGRSQRLAKTKQAGMVAPKPHEIHAPNVINLMDALRRSIAEGGTASGAKAATSPPAAAAPPAAATKGRKAKASSPEDLRKAPQFKMPIPGGKTKAKEEPVADDVPKAKSWRKFA